jgi:PucR C-terminal helix-turn-helix domain/GAF domain
VLPVIPLLIREEVMDELLAADEPRLAEQLDEHLEDVALYAEYRRLVAEQAALRRLATLVARGVEPSEVFDAVTKEMCRCVPAEGAGLWRYETSDEITMVAATYHPAAESMKWPVGARTPTAGNTLASMVQRTGGPARMDTYENAAGVLATHVRAVGIRAAVGVPVIVDGRVWGLAAVGSGRPGPMPADIEVRISGFAELVASVVVAVYRDEQKRQLLSEASQRPFLIDSLLEGRAVDRWSLCEMASHLRLPADGPFVVIVAEGPAVGIEALPEVESKLRSRDVYSAWRLRPDMQVGIDTPQALHFATVMLRGRPHQASPVAVFDGSILATAALSAPDVMVKLIGNALDGFDDLPDAEREMLFETFRVWQDSDASVRSAAEVLICHPNTVRHRLRRIERRTSRSLSRPKDVAELCLALEVRRRLM